MCSKKDGTMALSHCEVCCYINENLPDPWIGCAVAADFPFHAWPSELPELTPRNFFLSRYVKDAVHVSHLQ
jgi:hypothetical protein